jgi:hypothetical protein
MKKELHFTLTGIDSVSSQIKSGLSGYAVNLNYGLTTTIWLFLCNNSVLVIQSNMNELDGWEEVGTLKFINETNGENLPKMIPLPLAWQNIVSLAKLLIEDDEFIAESGLVIRNNINEEVIIVCGAELYSLQMAASFFESSFNPEYDFEKYKWLDFNA